MYVKDMHSKLLFETEIRAERGGGGTATAFPLDVAIGGGGCNSLSVGVVAIRVNLFKTREKDDYYLVKSRWTTGWVFLSEFSQETQQW